jgi:hypothetical protein
MAQLVFAGGNIAETLQSTVGYVPANFNFLPWALNAQASDFEQSGYVLTRATVSDVDGPFGVDAQRLIPSTGNNTHIVGSEIEIVVPAIPIKVSAIAKAAGYSRIVLYYKEWTGDKEGSVGFDLTGGTGGYDTVQGSGVTVSNVAAEDLGDGWWLCSFRYLCATQAALVPEIRVDNGSGENARSVSFAGDGTSGVDVLWFHALPLAAWAMTNQVFQDNFDSLGTIDLENTKAPGFKWYINNRYADSSLPTFGWETNPPSAPSDPNDFSLSSPSILRIFPQGTDGQTYAGWISQIWSTVTDGAGGIIGYSHKPPLVYDALVNWDGSAEAYNPQWSGYAAFWGISAEGLQTPAISGLGSDDYIIELDVSEAVANTSTSHGHVWGPLGDIEDNKLIGARNYSVTPAMVLGEFRRLSLMWLRPEDTGTDFGFFARFIDGKIARFSTADYEVGGIVASCDQQHINVILNTSGAQLSGEGQAFYIDWVRIYSTPD